MAQLYFYYSTMNSGKTFELQKTAYNYENQGKKVLIFTSEKDTRNKKIAPDATQGVIATRVGLEREAYLIERIDVFELAKQENPVCVLVDEAQFLSKNIILTLTRIVDELNIPVICYGLKSDFVTRLFEGSAALLLFADKIQEIKTVCWYCNHKAIMNLRLKNGKPTFEGDQIAIGGNFNDPYFKPKEGVVEDKIVYLPTCRKCYMQIKKDEGANTYD